MMLIFGYKVLSELLVVEILNRETDAEELGIPCVFSFLLAFFILGIQHSSFLQNVGRPLEPYIVFLLEWLTLASQ